MNVIQELTKLKFQKQGVIVKGKLEAYPIFKLDNEQDKSTGLVYAWVKERENENPEIIYIGKAGKTLKTRCGQHNDGFNGKSKSNIGLANGVTISSLLKKKYAINLYVRKSETKIIFGQEVSLNEAEEAALLKKFHNEPLLNKLK